MKVTTAECIIEANAGVTVLGKEVGVEECIQL